MKKQNPSKSVSYAKSQRLLRTTALMSTVLTGVAEANVVGSPFQNFNPTAGGREYVTVEPSRTLGSGEFSLGLFLNQATNTLPYQKDSEGARTQSRSKINDTLLSSDLAIGIGLFDILDVGLVLPMVLNQSVKSDDDRGQFAENGITEYRVSSKIRLYQGDGYGFALAGSANINQTNNNPYSGLGGGPAYNVQLISDFQFGRMSVAANIGYRWLNSGPGTSEVPIQPFANHVIASTGVDYAFSEKWHGIFEVYGGQSSRNEVDFSERQSGSAEALAGMKYFSTKDLAMHFGGGTELQHGTATPDWRIYTGISWNNGINRARPAAKTLVSEVPPPAPAVAGPPKPAQQPETVVIVSDVLFGFNSSRLVQKGTFKNLENLIHLVTKKPDLDHLIIEGHTCNIGNDAYNKDLSRRRAESIKELLVKKYQIPAEKIQAIGHGEAKPVATNTSKEGRAKNRRVEFKIYRKAGSASESLISKK